MKTLTVAYTAYCVLRHSYLLIMLLVQVGEGQAPSISSNGKYDQIRDEVEQSHFRCSTVSSL